MEDSERMRRMVVNGANGPFVKNMSATETIVSLRMSMLCCLVDWYLVERM